MQRDLDYIIAVMQAAKEGKKIECKIRTNKSSWDDSENPLWDWRDFDYRVKVEEPESEYVPYDSQQEVLDYAIKHNYKRVYSNTIGEEGGFISIDTSNTINILHNDDMTFSSYTLAQLLEFFKWQDGTPCGKLK